MSWRDDRTTVSRLGPGALCRLDDDLMRKLAAREQWPRIARNACLTILAGAAAYGFAFGAWRSPRQGLYSALKMPLLMYAVVAASGLINTMLAHVCRAGLSLKQVCTSILIGMSITSALLGALSPIVLFVVLQLPPPDPAAVGLGIEHPLAVASMRTYWPLLLAHVALIAVAGILGVSRLYRLLRSVTSGTATAARLLIIWLAVAGFVGCELSWLLSPFLCKPTQQPHIVPREYFQQNFYERVWSALTELS